METNDKNNPVVTISAKGLHRILLKTHRIGNRNRLKFIRALYALYESRLYLKLGITSIVPYAEKYFGLRRTQTFDRLRVAGVLEEIPKSVEKFNSGEIPWSVLVEISRVVTAETEETWLEWAREKPFRQLRAEVQDALKKNRALPRKNGYGISNLTISLIFKLTLQEHDLVSKAFQKIGGELLESLGGEGPLDPKTVLLYMARRFLETDPAGTPPERAEKDGSIYTLLYRTCPKCLISHVSTSEGPVEVPHEHIERIEAEAEKVVIRPQEEIAKPQDTGAEDPSGGVIDRPNPPSLVKKVILRDGVRCANPMCGRTNVPLHAHHIRQRSEGGPTELFNELALCIPCHSSLHLGLMAVTGDPLTGLEWTCAADRIVLSPESEKEDLANVPVVVVAKESGIPDSSDRKSAPSNSSLETSLQWVVLGLVKLGYTKTEGKERARDAYLRLKAQLGREPLEKEIFEAAVRMG